VRALFAKILLYSLAAMLITIFGFVLITTRSFTAARGRGHLVGRMMAFQLEEARHAYESGGKGRLTEFLGRVREDFGAQGVLTDASVHDLLTGADRRDLYREFEHRVSFFQPRVLARASADGRYWFFLIPARGRPGFSFFLPQYLWIVGAMVLLSYLLALHLTSPLRRLQKAVERFGKGEMGARVESTRRDELGQLARTFDQMADRLQTLLAAERRLLLDISHELRSPLARLSVAVELARSSQDLESREAALNRIEKEAERLNAMVGELLQVTRVEADPRSLRREPVRLDDLLGDVVEDCAVEAGARGCSVTLKSAPPLTVSGDAELLRRAVENVVRNAIRHTAPETTVEVTLEQADSCARIQVRDRGPGVAPEHLPRIFDPFYRVETDRNRSSGGVGLGLAIARRAIELHKGRIQARNADPGLLVQIQVPMEAASC
jgi:signal transduction histidine kinase